MRKVDAFKGYVLKITSRCNLNCTYCYMYNLADQSWRHQPKQMSMQTLQRSMERIRDHSLLHGQRRVKIGLHGGEPLLLGPERLDAFITCIQSILQSAGIQVRMTVQTNGLLFNRKIGDVLARRGVTIGVSLDGTPEINDQYRVDHKGLGSSARLEPKIRLLASEYQNIFAGLLCVINPGADPQGTFKYLASFEPPAINFLLPLNHHDNRPIGKELDVSVANYGEWLATAFDCWATHEKPMRVLIFNSIINLLNGGRSVTESHGLDPAEIVVIETNGDVEAVDSLKATEEFATQLGMNVLRDDLDAAYQQIIAPIRADGLHGLPVKCQSCEFLQVCGGGDLATRYSSKNKFQNVSIYCADYIHLINHIREKVAVAREWQKKRTKQNATECEMSS